MPSLAQLQKDMRRSIIARQMAPQLNDLIVSDGLSAERRLQIYQNNYQGLLVDALLGVFPIVSAFVGDVFTRTALKHFITTAPPKEACLSNYGGDFPDFLADYEHLQHVLYVADIARLEWAIHELQHACEVPLSEQKAGSVNLNTVFIKSDYPLLNLWMVGAGQMQAEAVHIDQGGQRVCVVLNEGQIQLFAVSQDEHEGLRCLKSGLGLKNEAVCQSLRNKNILI